MRLDLPSSVLGLPTLYSCCTFTSQHLSMKPVLTTLILTFALFIAGYTIAQKPTTPKQLSDHIDDISDSLSKLGKAWGNKLTSVVYSKGFDSLVPLREKMQAFIEAKRTDLSSIADIKDSKKFRESMLAFLDFELKMIAEAFIPIEKLNTASSQTDINAAFKVLLKTARQEEEELEKVYKEQVEYSKKNKFKIRDE